MEVTKLLLYCNVTYIHTYIHTSGTKAIGLVTGAGAKAGAATTIIIGGGWSPQGLTLFTSAIHQAP